MWGPISAASAALEDAFSAAMISEYLASEDVFEELPISLASLYFY
jgi:hypothetical protein